MVNKKINIQEIESKNKIVDNAIIILKKEFVGIKNPDLWIKLDKLNIHMGSTIQWNWVKGHSTDVGNIEADRLANLGCTMLNK